MTPIEMAAARALVATIKRGDYVIPDAGLPMPLTERGRERHWLPVYWFSETVAFRLDHVGNDDGQFG